MDGRSGQRDGCTDGTALSSSDCPDARHIINSVGGTLQSTRDLGKGKISPGQPKVCLKKTQNLKEGAYWEKDHVSRMQTMPSRVVYEGNKTCLYVGTCKKSGGTLIKPQCKGEKKKVGFGI